MNRRVPNGTHGGVRGRKSPLETLSYSIVSNVETQAVFGMRSMHVKL